MAGDWIKMRASLHTHPKVLMIAEIIGESKEAGRKLTNGSDVTLNSIVSSDVTRDVTVASLGRVWCATNEHTDDGIWRNSTLKTIDQVAGVPGFGAAMAAAEWAIFDPEKRTVELPDFLDFNAPAKDGARASTGGERQKRYREKKKREQQEAALKAAALAAEKTGSASGDALGGSSQITSQSRNGDVTSGATVTGRREEERRGIKDNTIVELRLAGDGPIDGGSSSSEEAPGQQQGFEFGDDAGGASGPVGDGGGNGNGVQVAKSPTDAEKIEGIFAYWQRVTGATKARLGDKRIKTIRAALRWGYSPRDLCRAIQGCALTPHNQGVNARGQKYLGLHVCLGSEDQIDRFMANSKAPPVPAEKKGSGQIPGWWNSDELAKHQAALVGVGDPHPTDSRETYHARIRAAIENGGKPPALIVAPAPKPAEPEAPKVELTPEQKAANRAALFGALKKPAIEAAQ